MIYMDSITFPPMRAATLAIRALNHSLRQKIITLIEKEGGLNVTDIYVKLRIEQSVASQQLAILRSVGIVEATRDGKEIYYSLNYERIDYLHEIISEIDDNIKIKGINT